MRSLVVAAVLLSPRASVAPPATTTRASASVPLTAVSATPLAALAAAPAPREFRLVSVAAPLPVVAARLAPVAAALDSFTPPDKGGAEDARSGGDRLGELLTLHDAVRSGTAGPLPADAAAARWLIVPGLFGNSTADAYGANLRRLRALGADARLVALDTEGRRAAGLAAIDAAVRAAPGPVVLWGHSRGGVLAHDWYRSAPAELKAKVARLVLMQAPLAGTPFADWSLATTFKRLKLALGGRAIYGVDLREVTREMTLAARAFVLARLPAWTAADLAKVFTLRTAIEPSEEHGYFDRQRAQIAALGSPLNDGVVPAESARVPGAGDALMPGVNHQQTMLQNPDRKKRRVGYRAKPGDWAGDLTEALARLLFR